MSSIINASTSSGLVTSADTSGTVEIQSNGSTKLTVSSTGAYGQLVSATAQTASSTAVDFTGIPSWAKRITVMFTGVSTNGTSNPMVQLGDSGGFENTGYTGSAAFGSTYVLFTAGLGIAASTAAASVFSGQMIISKLDGNTWVSQSTVGYSNAGGISTGAGAKTLSDTLTQVRITTVNGTDTFDAGSINILYEG
jgi:hypothetical protein